MIVLVHKFGLIFCGFHTLEVEFFQLNLLHLRPGWHYTPVGCHGMKKLHMVDSPIPAFALTCKKAINGFLCLLIVCLKRKAHQLNLKDVIKFNRNLR